MSDQVLYDVFVLMVGICGGLVIASLMVAA